MRQRFPLRCLGLLCIVACAGRARADTGEKAQVVDAFGIAQKHMGADATGWHSINVGDLLPTQTTVRTGDNSAVLLQLPDHHMLRIGAATTIELKQLGKDKAFSFSVLGGRIWSFVRRAAKPTKYEIETPSAVVGVSGTIFSVFHDRSAEETTVSTLKGEVQVQQGERSVAVGRGYATQVRRGQTAPLRALVQSADIRRMWQAVGRRENWMSAGASPRLDRQVEQTYSTPRHNIGLPRQRPSVPGRRRRPG